MDFTMAANLLWDVATGVSVGLLAYGAWLCLNYRLGTGETDESHAAPASVEPTFR